MLLPMLAVSVQPLLMPKLQKILSIIQEKIEHNENGRQIFWDCLRNEDPSNLSFTMSPLHEMTARLF